MRLLQVNASHKCQVGGRYKREHRACQIKTSVKYALSHSQPTNLLDEVLPLHAASSGGNGIMVKLLIEEGVLRGERFSFSFCVVITLLSSNLAGSSVYLVGMFYFRGYIK